MNKYKALNETFKVSPETVQIPKTKYKNIIRFLDKKNNSISYKYKPYSIPLFGIQIDKYKFYEGDILQFHTESNTCMSILKFGKYQVSDCHECEDGDSEHLGFYLFYPNRKEKYESIFPSFHLDNTVIGNIYENNEILKFTIKQYDKFIKDNSIRSPLQKSL